MEMLETKLAFAVAMILFSTVVAGLVEAALRTFARRPALIHRGVTQLIAEIARENPALVRKAGLGALDAWRPALADHLTGNRMTAPAARDAHAAADAGYPVGAAPKGLVARVGHALRLPLYRLFGSHPAHAHRVETLTAYGFADRLKDHRLGRAITLRSGALDTAEDALAPADREDLETQRRLWRDVVRRYERYRALTHESVRRSANRLTLIVALVFALVFNVDASRLIAHLVRDAEARRSLALSSEAITTEARARYAAIAERLAELDAPSDAGTGDAGTGRGRGGQGERRRAGRAFGRRRAGVRRRDPRGEHAPAALCEQRNAARGLRRPAALPLVRHLSGGCAPRDKAPWLWGAAR